MSHAANGLFPLAGGFGVPDAWFTTVVAYGPADAAVSGMRTINAAATTAARRTLLPIAHLHRSNRDRCGSCQRSVYGATFVYLTPRAQVRERRRLPSRGQRRVPETLGSTSKRRGSGTRKGCR